LPSLIMGTLITAFFAAVIGWPMLRIRGPYFALGTLAIGQVLYILAVNWKKLTNGSEGLYIPFEPQIHNFIFEDKIPYLLVSVVIASLVFYLCRFIETSRIGYQLVAIREDEDAARSLGVNPVRTKVFAFTASAILTAIPGTFYAQYIQFIEPANVLSLHFSIQIPLIAIIGGVGVSYGPFLGSLIIIPLSLFLRASLGGKFGAIHMALYGAVLVFVVIALQQGVAPAIRDRFFRKK
jgi:branched-chain amino acid transport system permease protein